MGFIAGWTDGSIGNEKGKALADRLLQKAPPHLQHDIDAFESNFAVTLLGKTYTHTTERFLLYLAGNPSRDSGSCKKLFGLYQQERETFVQHIPDPFTLVLSDRENQVLILAVDRIGQQNIYYSQTENGLVFGSSADYVIQHPAVNAEISMQAIYDYVYFHHCPSPTTIYKQVMKLQGGQVLLYKNGRLSVKRYWVPEFSEAPISITESSEELLQRIKSSVHDCAVGQDETGAFLSGGLDSSTVAGALAGVFPGKAKTFSMGFPVQGYDEIEYARIAVKHFQTRAHEYYVTPDDTVQAIPKIAAYYDEPFGNSSALAAYYCAKLAGESGIKILLAGDGGDELFAGNERYSLQLLFEHYYSAPRLVRKLVKGGLYNAPELLLKNRLLFKAKRYVEQAEVPLPDRLQDYNFLHRHPGDEIFVEDFLAGIDTESPLQSLRDCYQIPEAATSLNRMLYMDWKSTLHDNDLVKVNKMCEMAGLKVQYPLLSQSIVDFSCRIPSNVKLKNRQLRWFYKEAMKGFLPDTILNKSKHGFGLPFGIWLKDYQPLQELAYDSVQSLKHRSYFRDKFIDHAINMHQSIHAAYYGELIWILMMLELWFQAKFK